MKRILIVVLATSVVAMSLMGCSSPEVPSKPSVAPVTSTPVTPTPSTETSPRGNIVKRAGDVLWITDKTGANVASFVVTKITVDAPCTAEYAVAAERGHFVRFDIEGTTEPTLPQYVAPNFLGLKVVADNGTTVNGNASTGAAFSCLPREEQLPPSIGPGENVRGSVIYDVPTPTGVLILPFGPSGWEWVYGP